MFVFLYFFLSCFIPFYLLIFFSTWRKLSLCLSCSKMFGFLRDELTMFFCNSLGKTFYFTLLENNWISFCSKNLFQSSECLFFFIFSYPCMIEKVLFFRQIFEIVILMDLHVLRACESENYLFSCLFFCVPVIIVIQKQITA